MDIELFYMNNEREKKLWSSAIFVFDSSALLNLYLLPKSAREKLFKNFNSHLKNRLWIPSHVYYEYNKNRKVTIRKPISKNYIPLKDINLSNIKKSLESIENSLSDLRNKTKTDNWHPYLSQKEIEEYSSTIEGFAKSTKLFEDKVSKDIDNSIKEIEEVTINDDVLTAIIENFKIGEELLFNKIIKISKEGKHRYEFSIPPGYQDAKVKIGTQIFGDLIIWKQLLKYAKEEKKPILFICDDLKEDWWNLTKDKKTISPRDELIQEIFNYAKVEFWMYDLTQYLLKSNKYIAITTEEKIEENKIQDFSKYIINEAEIANCDVCFSKTSFVIEWLEEPMKIESMDLSPNNWFHSCHIGYCNNCDTLHVRCPKCKSLTALRQEHMNEKVECKGRCGLAFVAEPNIFQESLGLHEIQLVHPAARKCLQCGNFHTNNQANSYLCKKCNENLPF